MSDDINEWLREVEADIDEANGILANPWMDVAHGDGTDVEGSGWGLVFGESVSPEIREAMWELQAFRDPGRRENRDDRQMLPEPRRGESFRDFLARCGAFQPNAPVENPRLPYYVLIVASPADISFDFQFGLSRQFAVGRLWLGEKASRYRGYLERVRRHETGGGPGPRRADWSFYVPPLYDDGATDAARHGLVCRLTQALVEMSPDAGACQMEEVTSENLRKKLQEHTQPKCLFFLAHGSEGEPVGGLLYPPADGNARPQEPFAGPDWCDPGDFSGSGVVQFSCYSAGKKRSSGEEISMPAVNWLSHTQGALFFCGYVNELCEEEYRAGFGCFHTHYLRFFASLREGQRVGAAFERAFSKLALHCYRDAGVLARWTIRHFGTERWNRVLLEDTRKQLLIGDPAVRLWSDQGTETTRLANENDRLRGEIERLKAQLATVGRPEDAITA